MFAALCLQDFLIIAALRNHAMEGAYPCAVLEAGPASTSREKLPLLATNPAARIAGIRSGWPLHRALVRCPDLRILSRDPAAEAILRNELFLIAESLAADVELTAPDAVIVDLSGRSSPVTAALDRLTLAGATIHHARALTPDLAHLASRHPATRGKMISPADLAPLPFSVLDLLAAGHPSGKLLESWGLRTLGDFMELPRQAVTERLGPDVGTWHDLLHGKTCRLLRLHRPPESFGQVMDFDDPLVSLDPLVFALKRLLHTLAGRLASRHLAASCLEIRLVLTSGAEWMRRVRLPEPQTAVEGMLSPLQTLIDSLKPAAPIAALRLDVETTFATAAQREWFGRQLPQPERWAETVAKLDALLGHGRVGIPAPGDSFAPDAFVLHPAARAPSAALNSTAHPACPVPLHRFRPPREVAVAHELRNRKPWPLALLTGPHPGEITDRRGPFPISGDWWNPDASWQRLEWDIQLMSHHLLRLVFQTPNRWTLEGIYR
jgi:protein ImuB